MPTDNAINANEIDYLYTKTSQLTNAGNGLFTAIKIYKDEIIAQFKGKILTKTEANFKIKNNNDAYFINMINGTILDCKNTKGFAKMANDAKGFAQYTYKNNAQIALSSNNKVCLIATKNININDEIFCNYGKKYWKKHAKLMP